MPHSCRYLLEEIYGLKRPAWLTQEGYCYAMPYWPKARVNEDQPEASSNYEMLDSHKKWSPSCISTPSLAANVTTSNRGDCDDECDRLGPSCKGYVGFAQPLTPKTRLPPSTPSYLTGFGTHSLSTCF